MRIALILRCPPPLSAQPQAAVRSTRQALLYASGGNGVYYFSYPSGKPLGRLSGFDKNFNPGGLCIDNAGDVFVTGFLAGESTDVETSQIYEFMHGGTTPIAKLAEKDVAAGCSVDPTTGDLSVSNYFNKYQDRGSVARFIGARGKPTYYVYPKTSQFHFCAYDDAGNLFISRGTNGLEELPHGETTFQDITLSNGALASSVQWRRGELVVSSYVPDSRGPMSLYRTKVSNDTATVVGTTTLSSPPEKDSTGQFWIDGANVAGPIGNHLFVWSYPGGGNPIKRLHALAGWVGVTVSR
ncbi:MAG: hypothetical protein JO113_06055 [Candidatus Eremiobacteraeota bacterium]|nr:hypothetical protein [Candidatus Eremiobacteraeota bacterium]